MHSSYFGLFFRAALVVRWLNFSCTFPSDFGRHCPSLDVISWFQKLPPDFGRFCSIINTSVWFKTISTPFRTLTSDLWCYCLTMILLVRSKVKGLERNIIKTRDLVVRRPISANPWWNFHPGSFFSLFRKPFSNTFLFTASGNNTADKNNLAEFFKAFRSEITFHTNLGLYQTSFEQPSPRLC